jgi:hypothetical protein
VRTRLQIPNTSTELVLSEDWTFPLYHETRNLKFLEKLTGLKPSSSWGDPYYEFCYVGSRRFGELKATEVTVPKGTTLIVDRVYIRKPKHLQPYNSVTFCLRGALKGPKAFRSGRFWAKLVDVNRIECEVVGATILGGSFNPHESCGREESGSEREPVAA